jgi:hypothetical protein
MNVFSSLSFFFFFFNKKSEKGKKKRWKKGRKTKRKIVEHDQEHQSSMFKPWYASMASCWRPLMKETIQECDSRTSEYDMGRQSTLVQLARLKTFSSDSYSLVAIPYALFAGLMASKQSVNG